jgi:hypothetical protein
MIFFKPTNAFARYVANRALRYGHIIPCPNDTTTIGVVGQKSTSSFSFQALLPAGVALPCGLICILKVEGDS